jgi:hypothetical protein
MRKFALAGLMIAAMAAAGAANAQDEPYCREYQQRVTIGGVARETYGTACMQPDGSWKMVEPGTSDEAAILEQPEPVQVAQTSYVERPVVYEEPVYYPEPVYPAFGLSLGYSDYDGHGGWGRGGGWHGGHGRH